MRVYNIVGYTIIFLNILVAGIAAPTGWSFISGASVGFLFLLYIWFVGGIYASNILHMGIAHKTMNFKDWFVKFITRFFQRYRNLYKSDNLG